MRTNAEKLFYKLYDDSVGRNIFAFYVLLYTVLTSRYPLGSNVFDEEWDLLVVLDACRVDALRAVQDEYPFISNVQTARSVGSTSKEWIDRTFTEGYRDEVRRTAYVTANPFSNQIREPPVDYLDYDPVRETFLAEHDGLNRMVKDTTLTADEFAFYDPAWFSIDADSRGDRFDVTTPFPDEMTDRAITAGRKRNADRVIVHYMQPHQPYLATALERDHTESWEHSPFDALRNGEMTFDDIWAAYLDNLRYVLDHVAVLLRNVDAPRVVITADHGKLFGEWGLYSHTVGLLHPKLRTVPWVETTARDTRERTPAVDLTTVVDDTDPDLREHLEALGYG